SMCFACRFLVRLSNKPPENLASCCQVATTQMSRNSTHLPLSLTSYKCRCRDRSHTPTIPPALSSANTTTSTNRILNQQTTMSEELATLRNQLVQAERALAKAKEDLDDAKHQRSEAIGRLNEIMDEI